MKKRYVFLLLILAGSLRAERSASLVPYLSCLKAVSSNSPPTFVSEGIAVLSGSRLGSDGIYVVTLSNVYYQPLPLSFANEADLFYRVRLPGVKKFFLHVRGGKKGAVVSRVSKPSSPTRLFSRRGLGILDVQFREMLDLELESRVQEYVYASYKKGTSVERLKELTACFKKMPLDPNTENLILVLSQAIEFLSPPGKPIQAGSAFFPIE